jgi:hypothetical protein
MKMKNLNNKQIIKINELKFKKTSELKQTIKLRNRKKSYNLRIYLIAKNRYIKKIENELLKIKLELQNQQKAYKL